MLETVPSTLVALVTFTAWCFFAGLGFGAGLIAAGRITGRMPFGVQIFLSLKDAEAGRLAVEETGNDA